MKKPLFRLLISLLLVIGILFSAACNSPDNGGETDLSKVDTVTVPPRFDYQNADLSPFLTINSDWRELSFSVENVAPVSDADVKSVLDSQLKSYYPAIADATAPVKKGDTLYLYYMGITMDALNKAVADGKIADADCTGMSYSDIGALGINFEGGTTSSLLALKVGSANYIDGFEDGLVGAVPADHGEEDPLRLHLTFPTAYGNAALAGKEVIFFCNLFYIGDTAKPALTSDTVTADELNAILGFTGEAAYPSAEACLATIKEDLEKEREAKLFAAKATALNEKLAELATFGASPEAALEYHALSWLSGALEEMKRMYTESSYYYQLYFGSTTPNLETLVTYYGYSADNYLAEMKEDSLPVVRRQLAFWAVARAEGITLTADEIATRRTAYIEKYGESIFEGVDDETVYQQFLYDKFSEMAIAYLEAKGAITYTDPAATE